MSQAEKSVYYQTMKQAGVQFVKHYREYTVDELKTAYEDLRAKGHNLPPIGPVAGHTPVESQLRQETIIPPPARPAAPQPPQAPVRPKDPNELAGARQNTKDADEPIRTDPDTGRVWYQEEVLKPAYPKPRGRRVLKYMDPGVEQKTVRAGDYTETFEVSGDPANAVPAEVKITLPSYQVGIYKDPRYPFKVVCYNGNEGFVLEEVQDYYGGAEMVPPAVKRKYVENALCYDIRSTVRAINDEFRQQQLAGKHR